MGGHEGNTRSATKRCLFLVSLFVTIYGVIVLSDNWPRAPVPPPALSLQSVQGRDDLHLDPDSLRAFLQKLDSWYETEVNVDLHHEEDHAAAADDGHSSHGNEDHEEDEEHGSQEALHSRAAEPTASEGKQPHQLDSPPLDSSRVTSSPTSQPVHSNEGGPRGDMSAQAADEVRPSVPAAAAVKQQQQQQEMDDWDSLDSMVVTDEDFMNHLPFL